ncbi:MAG: hypothetical protein ACE367_16385 [Acidimicrobiales bacterium]
MPDWSLVLAGVLAGLPVWIALQVDRVRLGFALAVAATAIALFFSDVAQLGIVIAVLTGLSLELPRPTAGRKAVVVPHRAVASYASVAALLLAAADLPNDPGTPLTVAAVVAMAAAAGVGWLGAHRLGPGFAWLLVALGAGAVYGAAPDTEQITVVAAALGVASLVILAWPDRAAPGVFTVAVAAALVVWAAAAGSGGRPAAFVSAPGAIAGLAVLAVAWGARTPITWRSGNGVVLAAIHAATAVVVARTGGVADDVAPAAVMAAAAIAAGGAAMWTAARRDGLSRGGGRSPRYPRRS